MTDETSLKPLLVRELKTLCQQGYRPGKASRLQEVPGLVGLMTLGGPDPPTTDEGWRERRERLRESLRDVIEEDIAKKPPPPLEKRDAEAALKLLRLDARQTSERGLQHIHPIIDRELFSDVGGEHFRKYRMEQTLEAIADALIAREKIRTQDRGSGQAKSARRPSPKGGRSAKSKRTVGNSPAKHKSGSARPKSARKRSSRSAQPTSRGTPQKQGGSEPSKPVRPKRQVVRSREAPSPISSRPATSVRPQKDQRVPRLGKIVGIALLGCLVVGLGLVAAWLVGGDERSNNPTAGASRPEQGRTAIETQPVPEPSPPALPRIRFATQIKNWCYCGDIDTYESQIKIKPRLVNRSSRWIDLRTGANARLALAIYAGGTPQRRWLSPTRPRYRRSGKWLLVPPNAPGDLVSSTSFESHWSRTRLRPRGEYFSPVRYEGDLVFNVPSDLYLHVYNVRLAYRLNGGRLYFPESGAVGQWRGFEDGFNF